MTSLEFMLDCVPEPVWKTTSGKCSSRSPRMTSSAACVTRSATSCGSSPSSALASAVDFFSVPRARIIVRPQTKVSRPMSKLPRERWVWAPQYLSAGTSTVPMLSFSARMSVMAHTLLGACDGPDAIPRKHPRRRRETSPGHPPGHGHPHTPPARPRDPGPHEQPRSRPFRRAHRHLPMPDPRDLPGALARGGGTSPSPVPVVLRVVPADGHDTLARRLTGGRPRRRRRASRSTRRGSPAGARRAPRGRRRPAPPPLRGARATGRAARRTR